MVIGVKNGFIELEILIAMETKRIRSLPWHKREDAESKWHSDIRQLCCDLLDVAGCESPYGCIMCGG